MNSFDITTIVSSFNHIGWNKPASLFEEYLKEQEAGDRLVWVAVALCHPLEVGDLVGSRLRGNDNEGRGNDNEGRGGLDNMVYEGIKTRVFMTFPYKLIDLTHALDSTIPTWNGVCGK